VELLEILFIKSFSFSRLAAQATEICQQLRPMILHAALVGVLTYLEMGRSGAAKVEH
jgi:hypothetical protein